MKLPIPYPSIMIGILSVVVVASTLVISNQNPPFRSLGSLYESCSAFYVAPDARSESSWVGLSRCSNFIDSVMLDTGMPDKVEVAAEDGKMVPMICPRPDSLWTENNERVFAPSEFVTMFLTYWDYKNPGLFTKLTTSASEGVVRSFIPRYSPCIAQSKSS
tara:strand:+ start:9670 stop:10152 length:483 start_codon:yes stop_codon:yes gene_type:complete